MNDDPRVPLPTSGASTRAILIKAGLLVPADVVAARPVRDAWVAWVASPPTCRLVVNREDHARRGSAR